jgi:hypothetical protein
VGVYQTPKSGAFPFARFGVLFAWIVSLRYGLTIDVGANFLESGFDLNFT